MNQLTTIAIACIGSHKTIRMAADELRRYLNLIDPSALLEVFVCERYNASLSHVIWVGLDEEFDKKIKPVEDKKLDDAIHIEVKDFCGIITGANERAVLIAVYRFLKELGVQWLCPGKSGEVIPEKEMCRCEVYVDEVPDTRHRVICNEGASSCEHLYDIIDWMPKMGMNGFFLQFFNPIYFLKRWYSHEHNNTIPGKDISPEEVERIHKKVIDAVTERGMNYFAVGHGWSSEPFGINSAGWVTMTDDEIPESIRGYLAEINGKRGIFAKSPLNTNVCYSNPDVIAIISNSVADYCEKNPYITHIVVFMADSRNNYCECETCRKLRPSDWNINIMNHIDAEMTRRGIETKVIFGPYNDLSWAPLEMKLNNPERFVMMFCPITRNYYSSYADVDMNHLPEEAPFNLNQLVMPRTNPGIVKLMKGWDDIVVGERAVFDYHLWSTTLDCDLGGLNISSVLSRDIKAFPTLDLNGFVSCQVVRNSFPTNIPMQVMADTLWNRNAEFDDIVDTYMQNAFGKEYQTVRDYLEKLSTLTVYWESHDEADVMVDEERNSNHQECLSLIAQMRPRLAKIFEEGQFENDVQKQFWSRLMKHIEASELVIKMQIRKFSGESRAERQDAIDAVLNEYCKTEMELHSVFDVWRQALALNFTVAVEDAH